MIIGLGTARGGMAERRRFLIAGNHRLIGLVLAVSRAREALKRLEAAGLDRLIVANRVKSPDTAANPLLPISIWRA
jgi:hypothetical protein